MRHFADTECLLLQQIFLIAVSLVMDYRVAIWFCVIFSGGSLLINIKTKAIFFFLSFSLYYMGDAGLNVDLQPSNLPCFDLNVSFMQWCIF